MSAMCLSSFASSTNATDIGSFELPRRDLSGTTITAIDGERVFVRDKAKEEQAFQKLRETKELLLERTSQGSQGGADDGILRGVDEVITILSSLHELNDRNEDSVLQFQHQTVKLSIERDSISAKLMGDMSRARSEWEQEKEGFALAIEKSENDVRKWKRRVAELGARCNGLEKDLKAKDGIARLWEAKGRRDSLKAMAGEERGSTITDTTSASTVDTTLSGDEAAPSEIEIDWTEAEEADDGKVEDQFNGNDLAAEKDGQQEEKIRELILENSHLRAKCQQLEEDNQAMLIDLKSLREEHEGMETLRDDLVDKVGDLAVENGRLLTKCQLLERARDQYNATSAADGSIGARPQQCRRVSFSDDVIAKRRMGNSAQTLMDIERRVALNTIEDLQAENKALEDAMEESMELASGMRDMMAYFTESARAAEEKLEGLVSERDEAYLACQVLQREIDLLRQASA